MSESWVQVAVDGAGKKIRNLLNNIAGTDVYQQVTSLAKSDGTLIDDPSRSSVTQPISVAVAAEVDGHSATVGATTDAASANTVIGRLKQAIAVLAGGLPAALAASGGLKVDVAGTGVNATAIKVDGSAVTQPVSGTVTANQGSAAANSSAWPSVKVSALAPNLPVEVYFASFVDAAESGTQPRMGEVHPFVAQSSNRYGSRDSVGQR